MTAGGRACPEGGPTRRDRAGHGACTVTTVLVGSAGGGASAVPPPLLLPGAQLPLCSASLPPRPTPLPPEPVLLSPTTCQAGAPAAGAPSPWRLPTAATAAADSVRPRLCCARRLAAAAAAAADGRRQGPRGIGTQARPPAWAVPATSGGDPRGDGRPRRRDARRPAAAGAVGRTGGRQTRGAGLPTAGDPGSWQTNELARLLCR